MSQADNHKAAELTLLWTQVQFEVSSFVAAVIPNYHDARDVVQQVAVVAISKFEEYDPDRSFRNWVLGIAHYEILKYRERHAREKLIFSQDIIEQIAGAYRLPEDGLDRFLDSLRLCLKTVKGRTRRALDMWYAEGIEVSKIAELLGTSTNAVYIRLHRARLFIKNCVERRLAGAEESI